MVGAGPRNKSRGLFGEAGTLAVLAGGQADLAAEDLGKDGRAGEANFIGDTGEGQVGGVDKGFDAFDAQAAEFGGGRAAKGEAEAQFELTAGNGKVVKKSLDVDGLAEVVLQPGDGLGDEGIFDGAGVGGLAGYDAQGGDQQGLGELRALAGEPGVKHTGGFEADADGIDGDAA